MESVSIFCDGIIELFELFVGIGNSGDLFVFYVVIINDNGKVIIFRFELIMFDKIKLSDKLENVDFFYWFNGKLKDIRVNVFVVK